jgi:hypothetical protein
VRKLTLSACDVEPDQEVGDENEENSLRLHKKRKMKKVKKSKCTSESDSNRPTDANNDAGTITAGKTEKKLVRLSHDQYSVNICLRDTGNLSGSKI